VNYEEFDALGTLGRLGLEERERGDKEYAFGDHLWRNNAQSFGRNGVKEIPMLGMISLSQEGLQFRIAIRAWDNCFKVFRLRYVIYDDLSR